MPWNLSFDRGIETVSRSWVSKLFMAEGHTHYWGPIPREHVGKITIIGAPNYLNYCVIFIVYTYSTSVTAGHIIQRSWSHVGDP